MWHVFLWKNSNYLHKCVLRNFYSFFFTVPIKYFSALTHSDRVMHICVSKLAIIGSDNGLSPGWRQAIMWTNAGILLIGLMGTNFSELLIKIYTFSFKKMHLKMSTGKWQPFCLGLIKGQSSVALTKQSIWHLPLKCTAYIDHIRGRCSGHYGHYF